MKIGKISESILKRSVLRAIKVNREELIKGAEVGGDCAFLSWKADCERVTALSTQTVTLPVPCAAHLAVMAAANNLAAAGGRAMAATISLTLPEGTEEGSLKDIMKQAADSCENLHIQIAGGHTEVSPYVNAPVITVTAVGTAPERQSCYGGAADRPAEGCREMDLVISKWVGMEGTAILACEKEEELLKRYPAALITEAKGFMDRFSVLPEAAIALKSGVYAMHDVRNGGIFGALWELSRKLGVGLSIDLKEIPVKQETIEICEFFNISPYELLSGGALIMAAEDGNGLVRELKKAGIAASVIGRTNDSNDRLILNGEETRYLGPPGPDEIYKIAFKEARIG